MSGKYGFVYILLNPVMTAFKIGCTERSPHARAEELSGSTGVPDSFVVACYAEACEFQEFERELHDDLDDYRVNPQREFFHNSCLREAVGRLIFSPRRLAFSCTQELFSYFEERDGMRYFSPQEIVKPIIFGDIAQKTPSSEPRGFRKRLRLVA